MNPKIAKNSISKQAVSPNPLYCGHPIDAHVGQRIRTLRTERTLSQAALGEKIGVTYQQVQKYETGTNRVGASMLFALARALEVDIATFYSGLQFGPAGELSSDAQERAAFASTAEGVRMLDALRGLPRHARRVTIGMITALAECFRSQQGNPREE